MKNNMPRSFYTNESTINIQTYAKRWGFGQLFLPPENKRCTPCQFNLAFAFPTGFMNL